jgi:hypothetical protein
MILGNSGRGIVKDSKSNTRDKNTTTSTLAMMMKE